MCSDGRDSELSKYPYFGDLIILVLQLSQNPFSLIKLSDLDSRVLMFSLFLVAVTESENSGAGKCLFWSSSLLFLKMCCNM